MKSYIRLGKQVTAFMCFFIVCVSYSKEIVIPFTVKNNQPIVEVVIEGEKYNFLFDTGAGITLIDKRLSKYLEQAQSVSLTDINKVIQDYSTVMLPKLSISGKEFLNLRVANHDLSTLNSFLCEGPIDGVIGRDIMKDCIVRLDPFKKEITFIEKEGFSKPKQLNAYSYKGRNSPMMKLNVFGKNIYAVFDTGSNGNLSITNSIVPSKTHELNITKEEAISARVGLSNLTNDLVETSKISGTTVRLNKLEFKNLTIDATSDHLNNMGFGIIKQFVSFLDLQNKVIYIDPLSVTQNSENDDLNNSRLTIHINHDTSTNKKLVLKRNVNDQMPLQLGDEVIKINDSYLKDLTTCDILDLLKKELLNKDKEDITFEVIRNEKTMVFSINKQFMRKTNAT